MQKTVNITKGLVSDINPASAVYPEGAAYAMTDCRVDNDGTLNRAYNISVQGSAQSVDQKVRGSNGLDYTVSSGTLDIDGGELSSASASGLSFTTSGTGTRQERGLYYYLVTGWDDTNKRETTGVVEEHWVNRSYSGDTRDADVPNITPSGTADGYLIYRSLKQPIEKGDTLQDDITPPTEFFYLGYTEGTFEDYAHDREIAQEERRYKGRGSIPNPTVDAIGAYADRMFYFYSNGVVRFSSAGRPEEVPQQHTIDVNVSYSEGVWSGSELTTNGQSNTYTLDFTPILENGVRGETKMIIPALRGKTVTHSAEVKGKLYVFTEDSIGYISQTASEGFEYTHITDQRGLTSPKLLSITPYGTFGADSNSLWRLEGLKDLSQGRVKNYIRNNTINELIWVEEIDELRLNTDTEALVYQADKDVFSKAQNEGYAVQLINGIYQCYAQPLSRTFDMEVEFYIGQSSIFLQKDNIELDMIFPSHNSTNTEIKIEAVNSEQSFSNEYTSNLVAELQTIPCYTSGRIIHIKVSGSNPLSALSFRTKEKNWLESR